MRQPVVIDQTAGSRVRMMWIIADSWKLHKHTYTYTYIYIYIYTQIHTYTYRYIIQSEVEGGRSEVRGQILSCHASIPFIVITLRLLLIDVVFAIFSSPVSALSLQVVKSPFRSPSFRPVHIWVALREIRSIKRSLKTESKVERFAIIL